MKSSDLHFYSNKKKAFFMMLLYGLFAFGGFYILKDEFLFETNFLGSSILFLGLILFLSGFLFSIWQLLRTKPLLTISESKIIIYHIFKNASILDFKEIESYFTIIQYTRGFRSHRQICIVMKGAPGKKNNFGFTKYLKK